MVAELLAGVDVADVYLDDGRPDGCYGIAYGYAGMAVSASIEHYAVDAAAMSFLQKVYYSAFYVCLVVGYHGFVTETLLKKGQIVVKSLRAVNLRLAFAEHIEIRTIDDCYAFHACRLTVADGCF